MGINRQADGRVELEYFTEMNARGSGWLLDVGCRFGSELHRDESKVIRLTVFKLLV